MIKILHCVGNMNRAGQETFLMNVFRHIDRNEFMFNFLCYNPEKGDYDEEIGSLGGKIFHIEDSTRKKGKIANFFYRAKKLAKWLSLHRDQFDIVQLHTYHNMDVWLHLLAAKKAKVKIIIHSHNSSGLHPLLHKALIPICNNYNHTRFACSKLAGEWMYGRRAVKKGKVTIINNGINLQKFRYDDAVRKEYRKMLDVEDHVVWGHVGRFNYQKNHKFLLNAFYEYHKSVPRSKLLLIGRGELEDEIKAQIKKLNLGDSVVLLGVRDDIDKLLNAFDYFVFPSLFEGLPVVLVEAQANGVPVVMSETISDEIVCNENTIRLPITNAPDWSKTILTADLNRTNDINVDDYDINKTVDKLERLYKEISQA